MSFLSLFLLLLLLLLVVVYSTQWKTYFRSMYMWSHGDQPRTGINPPKRSPPPIMCEATPVTISVSSRETLWGKLDGIRRLSFSARIEFRSTHLPRQWVDLASHRWPLRFHRQLWWFRERRSHRLRDLKYFLQWNGLWLALVIIWLSSDGKLTESVH